MGIQGLAARIKSTDGIEEDLREFTCHVDCASVFFGVIHSHGFHLDVAFAGKNARRQVSSRTIPTCTSTPPLATIGKRPSTDEAILHRKRARVNPTSQTAPCSIVATLQDMLVAQPPQIRFNQEKLLETDDIEETSVVCTHLLNIARVFKESDQHSQSHACSIRILIFFCSLELSIGGENYSRNPFLAPGHGQHNTSFRRFPVLGEGTCPQKATKHWRRESASWRKTTAKAGSRTPHSCTSD
jgi:hypothetical protein